MGVKRSPGLEAIDQQPVLRPQITPAPVSHPQTAILDLVPRRMKSLIGPIISEVSVAYSNLKLNVELGAAGVDSTSDMSGCEGEGMAGIRLAIQYLLSGDKSLKDLIKFSRSPYEQEGIEQALFDQYGTSPVMSVIGASHVVRAQLGEILAAHDGLAHSARYHPEIVGEAKSSPWYDSGYVRSLQKVMPFPDKDELDPARKVEPGLDEVLDRDALLRRAHLFYTDDTRVVTLEQAMEEHGPIFDRHKKTKVEVILEGFVNALSGEDDCLAWSYIAGYLIGQSVDLTSIQDQLRSNVEIQDLFARMSSAGVIKSDRIKPSGHVDPEQLYEPCFQWGLSRDDATYLASIANGNATHDTERTKNLLLTITRQVLTAETEKREHGAFSKFPEDTFEPPTLYNAYRTARDVEIFDLDSSGTGMFEGVAPIFKKMFFDVAQIDARSPKVRLDEIDPTIVPRLKRWEALDLDLLTTFPPVSRREMGMLTVDPWNLSEMDIDILCNWLNQRPFNQARLEEILLDLYGRYEEITGYPAIVLADLHGDSHLDEASLGFLEKVAAGRRLVSQPLIVSAVPFPSAEAKVGLDVLMTKLIEVLRSPSWDGEVLAQARSWAATIGRHPEYEASLDILKRVAMDVLRYDDEDGFKQEIHWMAYERKRTGEPVEAVDESFVLTALLPGFLEQGRRAAADVNVEAAQFSFELVRDAKDYLLACLTDDGLDPSDPLARGLARFNDDMLLFATDYHMAQSREKGAIDQPAKLIYEAIKNSLRLVGAHKMATPPDVPAAPEESPALVGAVESKEIATVPEVQVGVWSKLAKTWVGRLCPCLFRRAKEIQAPREEARSAPDKPALPPQMTVRSTIVDKPARQAMGMPAEAFLRICSVFESGGSFHNVSSISPLAATPAVLYALAERMYLGGNEESYAAVVEIARRVHYGYGNQPYAATFWHTVTQSDPQRFVNPDITSVEGFCPIIRFGDRYYLEILRIALQSAQQLLKKSFYERQVAMGEGRTEGPEFKRFAEAEVAFREMSGTYRYLREKFPGELSLYRQYNGEIVQGQVALEIYRNFDAAAHYFDRAFAVVSDRSGDPLPGQEMSARRARHARAELNRQWVDCHFFEQSLGEVPDEKIQQAITYLLQALEIEDSIIREEDGSVQHAAEYQLSFMQDLACLAALIELFRSRINVEDLGEAGRYYEQAEQLLREVHDFMVGDKGIKLLITITDQWLASLQEIWHYLENIAQKAPESALLAQVSEEWKSLYEDVERQLQERPPLA